MRKIALGVIVVLCSSWVQARDTEYKLPIKDVLSMPEFAEKVGNDVKFIFGEEFKGVSYEKDLGEFTTNKKTNSMNKTDEFACRWAMLSALIQFKDKTKELGGDAVVGLKSYYKKDTFSSQTEYECHAGALLAGVALHGKVVKLKQ